MDEEAGQMEKTNSVSFLSRRVPPPPRISPKQPSKLGQPPLPCDTDRNQTRKGLPGRWCFLMTTTLCMPNADFGMPTNVDLNIILLN